MIPFPIVVRELRTASRRALTYYLRSVCAAVAFSVALGMVYGGFWGWFTVKNLSGEILMAITSIGYVYALLFGSLITADCISQEKREGTLGFLFLTDLTGLDVVLGKMAANVLNALGGIIAIIPIPALGFIFGGLDLSQFAYSTVVLIAALIFATSTGIFCSTLFRSSRTALFMSWLLVLLPWGFTFYCLLHTDPATLTTGKVTLLFVSAPASMLVFTFMDWNGTALSSGLVWTTLALTLVYAAILVRSASLILEHNWRNTEARKSKPNLLDKTEIKLERKLGLEQKWQVKRQTALRYLLEHNPGLWLAERLQKLNWGFWSLGMLSLLTIVPVLSFHRSEKDATSIMILTCLIMMFALKFRIMMQGSRAFAESRRNGALAILLATPLTPREIIHGQLINIKRSNLSPIVLVFLLHITLVGMGLPVLGHAGGDPWTTFLLCTSGLLLSLMLIVDLYALSWTGLWMGLNTGSGSKAMQRNLAIVLICQAPTLFGYVCLLEAFASRNNSDPLLLIFASLILNLFINGSLLAYAIGNLHDRFRELATATQN
jgi:ABC-type transport system involved in multi-copper enzyme maturation permease subunit